MLFAISAAIFMFGNIIYCIFGKTEAQPWNAPNESDEKEKDEKQETIFY